METLPIKLIVGLGNPGPKYTKTRHNAGFWFIDEIISSYSGKTTSKFSADIAEWSRPAQSSLWLQKPTTFMNKSGVAVKQISQFYKITPAEILVVHDEIDLPPGQAKLKWSGGHGGHNGLRDIFTHIGKDFWRLRVGVGHPGSQPEVINYVLDAPGKNDAIDIARSIDQGLAILPQLTDGQFEQAMHQLHTKAKS